ncbi:hypothetical protein V6N11_059621 [Hibiscus sabdariffa]|uniref:Uncharacterized protein n=1 Tax=Hibiscus sabdariffa TaxID=183260 RepID=A0ABR2NXZ8_9ROSI
MPLAAFGIELSLLSSESHSLKSLEELMDAAKLQKPPCPIEVENRFLCIEVDFAWFFLLCQRLNDNIRSCNDLCLVHVFLAVKEPTIELSLLLCEVGIA